MAGQSENASKSRGSLYLTDHLGSTRAVVDDSGNVLETFDYYPFGLLMPKRNTAGANTTEKFSGKELDENINQYYFGARYYDPALGRFFVTDRFADKYPSMTPYQYAANNPVGFVDVNGDSLIDQNKNIVNVTINEDNDGNRTAEFTFAEGTSEEVIDQFNENAGKVINAMLQTDIGEDQVNELNSSENLIGITLSPEKNVEKAKDGNIHITYGTTRRAGTRERQITVYEGSVALILAQNKQLPGQGISALIQKTGSLVGGIGSVGVHESVHATSPLSQYADENLPNALQILYIQQFLSKVRK